MATRDKSYLITDRFLDFVFKNMLPLLSWGLCLFTEVFHNRYLTRGSSRNAHSITINGNVSVVSWVILLVTIPFLDFVMIHQIC